MSSLKWHIIVGTAGSQRCEGICLWWNSNLFSLFLFYKDGTARFFFSARSPFFKRHVYLFKYLNSTKLHKKGDTCRLCANLQNEFHRAMTHECDSREHVEEWQTPVKKKKKKSNSTGIKHWNRPHVTVLDLQSCVQCTCWACMRLKDDDVLATELTDSNGRDWPSSSCAGSGSKHKDSGLSWSDSVCSHWTVWKPAVLNCNVSRCDIAPLASQLTLLAG